MGITSSLLLGQVIRLVIALDAGALSGWDGEADAVAVGEDGPAGFEAEGEVVGFDAEVFALLLARVDDEVSRHQTTWKRRSRSRSMTATTMTASALSHGGRMASPWSSVRR